MVQTHVALLNEKLALQRRFVEQWRLPKDGELPGAQGSDLAPESAQVRRAFAHKFIESCRVRSGTSEVLIRGREVLRPLEPRAFQNA